jgi:hypothetical protein
MAATRTFLQRDPRYPIPPAVEARVEFNYPNPSGRRLSLLLLDISASGLSFVADHELPLVVRGANVDGVEVRVGDTNIEGKLVIKHLTRGDAYEVMYGGVFYPASAPDQQRLNDVISMLATMV